MILDNKFFFLNFKIESAPAFDSIEKKERPQSSLENSVNFFSLINQDGFQLFFAAREDVSQLPTSTRMTEIR